MSERNLVEFTTYDSDSDPYFVKDWFAERGIELWVQDKGQRTISSFRYGGVLGTLWVSTEDYDRAVSLLEEFREDWLEQLAEDAEDLEQRDPDLDLNEFEAQNVGWGSWLFDRMFYPALLIPITMMVAAFFEGQSYDHALMMASFVVPFVYLSRFLLAHSRSIEPASPPASKLLLREDPPDRED